MNAHIIGCGGTTHHLITPFIQQAAVSLGCPEIHLWDGDSFEERNISRQFLAQGREGQNKAVAMAEHIQPMYNGLVIPHPEFFDGKDFYGDGDLIIALPDNHAARNYCRKAALTSYSWLISGGNETTSGEAYILRPGAEKTIMDPWERWPGLASNEGRDPLNPGCLSEEVINDNPQIPFGNAMTAAMILMLFHGNILAEDQMSEQNLAEVRFCRNGLRGIRFKDLNKEYPHYEQKTNRARSVGAVAAAAIG